MRKYLTEAMGTFFLVLVIGLTGNPLAIGAMLMTMVFMGGHISGAHYNPAITLALMMRKKIESKDAIMYMVFQIGGATLAAVIFYLIKGTTFAPAPGAHYTYDLKPLLIEILFTFALTMVVLNVAIHSKTANNSFYGLAIGFMVVAAAFAGGPISGGAFNPAVGIGPVIVDACVSGHTMSHLWIYIIGPIAGSVISTMVYGYINPDEK